MLMSSPRARTTKRRSRKAFPLVGITLLLTASGMLAAVAASGTSHNAVVVSDNTHHPQRSAPDGSRSSPTSGPLVLAPTPVVHPPVASPTVGNTSPPYISETAAEKIAAGVATREGGGRIISSQLESVAAASQAVATRVTTLTTSTARMVWLVWVVGSYETEPVGSGTTLYYVTIDAKTGNLDGAGTSANMPGAPSVPSTIFDS